MLQIQSLPLVRIAGVFSLGLACSYFARLAYYPALVILLLAFIAYLALWKAYRYLLKPASYCLHSFAVYFLLFVFGFAFALLRYEPAHPQHISKLIATHWQVLIDHPPKPRMGSTTKWQRHQVRVLAALNDSNKKASWQIASGRLLLIVQSEKTDLQYGDLLLINAKPEDIPASKPGDSFDYPYYLSTQNIFQQAFVPINQYQIIAKNQGNYLMHQALRLKNTCLSIYQKYVFSEQARAFLTAFVLGSKQDMSSQSLLSFKNTGTLHILAVSGLHVGMLHCLLQMAFSALLLLPCGRFWQPICLLCCLLFYALLTGLAAGVCRATLMIACFVIGKAFRQASHPLNTLAAAYLFLLLWQPANLFNIGFQLSFSAVTGILLLAPQIANYLRPKAWILRQTGTLLGISLAAQLATAPLSVYYFHAFPLYFLLANLVLVPLAGIVLGLSIMLLPLSIIPFLAGFVGKILAALISGMYYFLDQIAGLPGAVLEGLALSKIAVCLLYISLIGLLYGLIKSSKSMLFIGLFGLLLLLCWQILIACRVV